jgi:hypothetical protein
MNEARTCQSGNRVLAVIRVAAGPGIADGKQVKKCFFRCLSSFSFSYETEVEASQAMHIVKIVVPVPMSAVPANACFPLVMWWQG